MARVYGVDIFVSQVNEIYIKTTKPWIIQGFIIT